MTADEADATADIQKNIPRTGLQRPTGIREGREELPKVARAAT